MVQKNPRKPKRAERAKEIKKEELKSKKFCTTILLLYFYIWFI